MPNMTREQALAKARKILADAGYPGGKGIPILQKDVTEGTTNEQFFQVFQRDCAAVGIRVEAFQTTWVDMLSRIRGGRAQMWGISWGADYPEAQNFLQLFYGPNKAPGVNGSNYDNPEFNALYEQALPMQPSPERTDLYRRMERMVIEDCVWSIRYSRRQFSITQPWLHNYKYHDLTSKYFKYCRVDQDRRTADLKKVSPTRYGPLLIGLAGFVLLVGLTLFAARNTRRGW
jgi:ABC-type transport system substrate-binding protein